MRAGWQRPLRGADPEQEAADEIATHLQMRIEGLVEAGWTEEAAQREAHRRFGDVAKAHEEFRQAASRRRLRMQRRERWGNMLDNIRYTFRQMRRSPGFATAVIGSLALALAANAVMFRIVDRLLLRPPEYLVAADRVTRLFSEITQRGSATTSSQMGYETFTAVERNAGSFDVVAATFARRLAVGSGAEARSLPVLMVSAGYWSLFDAPPALGRYFTADENRLPAGEAVAVLSHEEWRSRYGGSREVIGERLAIGSRDYTIIGVAPPRFTGLESMRMAAIVPIAAGGVDVMGGDFALDNTGTWLELVARRRDGVTVEAAAAEMAHVLPGALTATRPWMSAEGTKASALLAPVLRDRGPYATGGSRVALWLLGVAGAVLLIACANVANLLLMRMLQRRQEIAVRLALGITRRQLLAQLMTESLVFALCGAVVAWLIAAAGGGVLQGVLVPDAEWSGAATDRRVLLFTFAATMVTTLLTGLMPVLQSRDRSLLTTMRSSGRGGGRSSSRMRASLLLVQAGLSAMLLAGAVLFVMSLNNAKAIDLGFDPDRLLFVQLNIYGERPDNTTRALLLDGLKQQAERVPGVTGVALTTSVPYWRNNSQTLLVEGVDSTSALGSFALNAVSPEFFRTVGTQVLRGRGIDATDVSGAPHVAVVSESMARVLWPQRDPLGQCFRIRNEADPCRTVVGVVEDIRRSSLTEEQRFQYYLPWQQYSGQGQELFVRVAGNTGEAAQHVQRELQALAPPRTLVVVDPLQDRIDMQLQSWQLGATMFTVFGLLALVLTAFGLYSMTSYGVTQRRHEFTVRMALGARPADVRRLVVRQGTAIGAAGVAAGLLFALLLANRVQPLLMNVSARDPIVYLGVAVVLTATAVVASFVPARRGGSADLTQALRSD